MSKAIVDAIIRSSLRRGVKRFDTAARKYAAANAPHVHRIEYSHIESTIKNNFLISMKNVTQDNLLEDPRVVQFLEKISKKVYNSYVSKYKVSRDETIVQYPGYIYIYQPRLREKKLKAPIFDIALPLIKRAFAKIIKDKGSKVESSFTRATQFLHIGKETVGTETLRILGNTVSGSAVREKDQSGPKAFRSSGASDTTIEKNISKSLKEAQLQVDFSTGEAREAATNVIINMLRDLEITWKSAEKQLASEYRKDIIVNGTIGSSAENRPGSESYDWTNIRPAIEEEISKILFGEIESFASKAASMSPLEKVGRIATNIVVENVKKANNKNLRVVAQKDKVPKAKKDNSNLGKVNNRKRSRKKGTVSVGVLSANSVGAATKKNSPPRQNFLRLQTILNKKLPQEVRSNMGPPGLVNRSGTFSNSVRVTDITTTPQGYPSIGYTYQRSPYEVFELGRGRRPWSSKERDPRKLIDLSIRNIAKELILGRFFTRRM